MPDLATSLASRMPNPSDFKSLPRPDARFSGATPGTTPEFTPDDRLTSEQNQGVIIGMLVASPWRHENYTRLACSALGLDRARVAGGPC